MYLSYLGIEFSSGLDTGLLPLQMVQILVLLQVLEVVWELFQQKLHRTNRFLRLLQLKTSQIQHFIEKNLVFYLVLVSVQLSVHPLKIPSISKGHHPVNVVMRQFSWLQLSRLHDVIQRVQGLEKGREVSSLRRLRSTKW